ncbi:MAG: PEP-CTERM sorting domain-containing protein [Bryobacteraceae bacterium]
MTSVEDVYIPSANGYAVFGFDIFGFSDHPVFFRRHAEFNGASLGILEGGFGVGKSFKVPVRAGVPFAFKITLEASEPFDLDPNFEFPEEDESSICRPFFYDAWVAPRPIVFLPTPEPSTTAMLLIAGGFLAWRRRRKGGRVA